MENATETGIILFIITFKLSINDIEQTYQVIQIYIATFQYYLSKFL